MKREDENMEKSKVDPVIQILNFGRQTKVIIAGLDISRAIKSVEYSHKQESVQKPTIKLDIDIPELLYLIDYLDPDTLSAVVEILKPYMVDTNLIRNFNSTTAEN